MGLKQPPEYRAHVVDMTDIQQQFRKNMQQQRQEAREAIEQHRPKKKKVEGTTTKEPYWWIWANDGKGGHIVSGYYLTEEEAENFGYENFPHGFEVYPLHTKDKASATSRLKARYLGLKDVDMNEALRRVRHKF